MINFYQTTGHYNPEDSHFQAKEKLNSVAINFGIFLSSCFLSENLRQQLTKP
jgi:hypothetical protein